MHPGILRRKYLLQWPIPNLHTAESLKVHPKQTEEQNLGELHQTPQITAANTNQRTPTSKITYNLRLLPHQSAKFGCRRCQVRWRKPHLRQLPQQQKIRSYVHKGVAKRIIHPNGAKTLRYPHDRAEKVQPVDERTVNNDERWAS